MDSTVQGTARKNLVLLSQFRQRTPLKSPKVANKLSLSCLGRSRSRSKISSGICFKLRVDKQPNLTNQQNIIKPVGQPGNGSHNPSQLLDKPSLNQDKQNPSRVKLQSRSSLVSGTRLNGDNSVSATAVPLNDWRIGADPRRRNTTADKPTESLNMELRLLKHPRSKRGLELNRGRIEQAKGDSAADTKGMFRTSSRIIEHNFFSSEEVRPKFFESIVHDEEDNLNLESGDKSRFVKPDDKNILTMTIYQMNYTNSFLFSKKYAPKSKPSDSGLSLAEYDSQVLDLPNDFYIPKIGSSKMFEVGSLNREHRNFIKLPKSRRPHNTSISEHKVATLDRKKISKESKPSSLALRSMKDQDYSSSFYSMRGVRQSAKMKWIDPGEDFECITEQFKSIL
jgi:hypothetical protein